MNHNKIAATAILSCFVAACASTGHTPLDSQYFAPNAINYAEGDITYDWQDEKAFAEQGVRVQAEEAIGRYLSLQRLSYVDKEVSGRNVRYEALNSGALDRVYFQLGFSYLRLVGVVSPSKFGQLTCTLEAGVSGREVHYNRNGDVIYDSFFNLASLGNNRQYNLTQATFEENSSYLDVNGYEIDVSKYSSRCGFSRADLERVVESMSDTGVQM